jgi:hypothetical protein
MKTKGDRNEKGKVFHHSGTGYTVRTCCLTKASAAPRAAVVTKYLMIPAAAFTVTEDGKDFYNNGSKIGLSSGSGNFVFVAPVFLPNGARMRAIKLFAYDANISHDLYATLADTHPKTGGTTKIKEVHTTGSTGYQQPIKYLSHYVKWYYGYYIVLSYPASANLETCAVLIKYTLNQ